MTWGIPTQEPTSRDEALMKSREAYRLRQSLIRAREPRPARAEAKAVAVKKMIAPGADPSRDEWARYIAQCQEKRIADAELTRLRTEERKARAEAARERALKHKAKKAEMLAIAREVEAAQREAERVERCACKRDWLFLGTNTYVRILSLMPAEWAKVIIRKCAKRFNVRYEDLIGPKRYGEFVVARHLAMALIMKSRRCASLSVPQVGRIFNRDHTTILAAAEKFPSFRALVPSEKGQGRRWIRKNRIQVVAQ